MSKQQIYCQDNKNEQDDNSHSSNLAAHDPSNTLAETPSPEFAASGAGMAISNLLATQEKQMHHHKGAITGGPITVIQGSANVSSHHSNQSGSKAKPKVIDLPQQPKQKQKPQKPFPTEQDWSPVTDLSPIMDVSPSVEQAEQELIEHYNETKSHQQPSQPIVNVTRTTTGTISGMLADFSKALGLGKAPSPGPSPEDEQNIKASSVVQSAPVNEPTTHANSTTKVPSSNNKASVVVPSGAEKEKTVQTNADKRSIEQQPSIASEKQTSQEQELPHHHDIQKQHKEQQQQTQQQTTVSESNSRQQGLPKKVHRKLPQPTVEQMQAALASSASTRHKGTPPKTVATVSASGSVTNTVSVIPQAVATTVPRRTVPQMGTNVMRVEAMHHHSDYGILSSSLPETSIVLGKGAYGLTSSSAMTSSSVLTSNVPNSSTTNPRLSAVSPYRVIDNSIPRLRPEGKHVSPNSSPDDYFLRSSSLDGRKTAPGSFISSSTNFASVLGMPITPSKERVSTHFLYLFIFFLKKSFIQILYSIKISTFKTTKKCA